MIKLFEKFGAMSEPYSDDATALARLVTAKKISPAELLKQAIQRVSKVNGDLNCVVLMQEAVAYKSIEQGLPNGPFTGVPFLIKDLGAEAVDFPSHNGSALLQNTQYKYDSAIFHRMQASGVVTFGRSTSPEGGVGPVTEAAVYGNPTRNPWNLQHSPGGSSGGAAAAVAAGIVPIAHGSDGGGSVRIPASCCGLFGFKATRARFPDGPAVGEGWAGMAIDGFLSRSVRDNAAMMDACAGSDPGAPYAAPSMTTSYSNALARPPRRLRIGLCETTFTGKAIHPECRTGVLETGRLLEDLGHDVQPAIPKADHAGMMRAWTQIVACGTALWIKTKLASTGKTLAKGDLQGIAASAFTYSEQISGSDYLKAINQIHAYGRQMAAAFDHFDILLTATLAEPPAEIGRFNHDRDDYEAYRIGEDGVFAYSPFCAAFNASGQPAASVPLHWTENGLPVGIHLAAGFGDDATLIALCGELEQARPWVHRRPSIWVG